MMNQVTVLTHPLVQHKLSLLRAVLETAEIVE